MPEHEKLLYDNRRDLWSVSKMLMYCKGKTTKHIRAAIWEMLCEFDQSILMDLQRRTIPGKWHDV